MSTSSVAQLPARTTIWYDSTSLKKNDSLLYVGPDRATPLFALTAHLGWSGRSDITLHSGTDRASDPLVKAESKSLTSMDSMFTVHTPQGPITEKLSTHMHLTSEKYNFAIDVGTLTEPRPEKFEWRLSHGDKVKQLDGWKYGWKLVRLQNDVGHTDDTSDGKEVIAVWADPIKTLHEIGRFEVLGSAANGELGEQFPLIALLTAARIWQIRWLLVSL